ncbi:unnamed protein product, partial [Prorocentrum cordatum]
MAALRLSLAACWLAKAAVVEWAFCCLLIATRGIAVVSGFAAVELQALLHESMPNAASRWFLLQLHLHLDDLTIIASGFSGDLFFFCLLLTVSPKKSLPSLRFPGQRPGMPCGVDIVGASSAHLHRAQVAALRAALPPGANWNVRVGFAVLDAGGDSIDPARAAHAAPLPHWGLVRWQGLMLAEDLGAVFELSQGRVASVMGGGWPPWPVAAGPGAGVAAAACRPEWTRSTPRLLANDLGGPVESLLAPSAMAAAAVRGSVGPWRAQRVSGDPDAHLDRGAGAVAVLDRGRPRSTLPQRPGPPPRGVGGRGPGGPGCGAADVEGQACQLRGAGVAALWFTDSPGVFRADFCWCTGGSVNSNPAHRLGPASGLPNISEDLAAHEGAVLSAVARAADHRERVLRGLGCAARRVADGLVHFGDLLLLTNRATGGLLQADPAGSVPVPAASRAGPAGTGAPLSTGLALAACPRSRVHGVPGPGRRRLRGGPSPALRPAAPARHGPRAARPAAVRPRRRLGRRPGGPRGRGARRGRDAGLPLRARGGGHAVARRAGRPRRRGSRPCHRGPRAARERRRGARPAVRPHRPHDQVRQRVPRVLRRGLGQLERAVRRGVVVRGLAVGRGTGRERQGERRHQRARPGVAWRRRGPARPGAGVAAGPRVPRRARPPRARPEGRRRARVRRAGAGVPAAALEGHARGGPAEKDVCRRGRRRRRHLAAGHLPGPDQRRRASHPREGRGGSAHRPLRHRRGPR